MIENHDGSVNTAMGQHITATGLHSFSSHHTGHITCLGNWSFLPQSKNLVSELSIRHNSATFPSLLIGLRYLGSSLAVLFVHYTFVLFLHYIDSPLPPFLVDFHSLHTFVLTNFVFFLL